MILYITLLTNSRLFSTFWVGIRDVVVWWDRNSRRELGMNDRPYPMELNEIMKSPALLLKQ